MFTPRTIDKLERDTQSSCKEKRSRCDEGTHRQTQLLTILTSSVTNITMFTPRTIDKLAKKTDQVAMKGLTGKRSC
jgi:hypothetical protein